MKNNAFLVAFSIIFLIPGCMQRGQKKLISVQKLLETDKHAEELKPNLPSITVWVHGTRLLPQGIFEKFFFCKPGLNHYTSINSNYHHHYLASTLINADPKMFPDEYFYLFGWNGKLSFIERERAARKLYLDLKVVRDDYKKKFGTEPIIRLLGHSHGGNVILLLAQVKDPEDTSFFIHNVILMGTPVQKQTKHYVFAECFGKIYSLYSMIDMLQVIDPQGLQQKETDALFSERFFPVDEKIDQVAIRINNRSIMHIEFILNKFITQLPGILTQIDLWRESSKLSAYDWAKQDKCLYINTKRSLNV
jgi:hypothetical protein